MQCRAPCHPTCFISNRFFSCYTFLGQGSQAAFELVHSAISSVNTSCSISCIRHAGTVCQKEFPPFCTSILRLIRSSQSFKLYILNLRAFELASSAASPTPWSPNYPSRSKLWPMGPEIKIDLSKVDQVGGLWRWQSTRKITKFLIRVWIHSLWIWNTSIIFTDRILSPLLLPPLIIRSTRA